jgi:hypothetical protein
MSFASFDDLEDSEDETLPLLHNTYPRTEDLECM